MISVGGTKMNWKVEMRKLFNWWQEEPKKCPYCYPGSILHEGGYIVDDEIQILTWSRFSEDVYAASLYDFRASIKLKEDVPHIGTW